LSDFTTERPGSLKATYYVMALLLAILAAGPALWLLNVALQPSDVGFSELTPPTKWTGENFTGVTREAGIWRPMLNSVFVTLCQTVLNVLLAALAAYPLARMRFRGRDTLFVLVLATLMVPEQVTVVPLFVTISDLGLYDTLVAVFLPFSVTAFGIYLCRQAFLGVPESLEEAARIDGASSLAVWWHVMLPLSRPTLATLAVFSVIGAWSNLLWPLIVLQRDENFTLPVAINLLLGVFSTNPRYAYAASVLALVPMVIVYLLMQRWLTRGLLAGAVKG
jgi:putative chitobiose transport system permease protein